MPLRTCVAVIALAACAHAAAQPSTKPPAVPVDQAAKSIASVALVNAGFESTQPGKLGAPEGWWPAQHAGPTSYVFTLDDSTRQSGVRSLRIENVGPEPFGSIYQTVDASPYRGTTVRFAAWIRTQGATGNRFGAGAGLVLHSVKGGYPLDYTMMRKDAVRGTTGWARYEITLKIANEAERIEVGLNLYGPGSAWLDDAALDVIETPAAPAGGDRNAPIPHRR